MELSDAIRTRRSIRQFTSDPVTDEQVEAVLRAAMAAPSAGNQQPWRFVVVRDRDLLGRLAAATPYSSPMGRATCGLVVLGDARDEKHPGYWVQDCAAATQNALLAIHGLGLGAVWIGVHPIAERSDAVAEIVASPEGVVPFCMIAVGVPAETREPQDRFSDEYIHMEKWRS